MIDSSGRGALSQSEDQIDAVVSERPPAAIHRWLDALREELGAGRWAVGLREGAVWNVLSAEPTLYDALISQLLAGSGAGSSQRATLFDVEEFGDIGERLRTAGVQRLLIVPGGPDARIVLDAPDMEAAQRFVASRTGLGTSFDLSEALRAERLAADLVALANWWPDGVASPPATATIEGTLLAGRIASAAHSMAGSAVESRHTALLRERARIASVIHEGITQELTNVAIQLEVLKHVAEEPDTIRDMVGSSRGAVLQALESLRTVIFDLTPPEEEWTDLVGGLAGFVTDFQAQWGLAVAFTVHGESRELDAEIVSMAFALVQEALTNVRRHAQTTSAEVSLTFTAERLHVEVRDQGRGIGAEPEDDLRLHQGLKIIASRARLLDGRLTIDSSPGEGTCVHVEVPA